MMGLYEIRMVSMANEEIKPKSASEVLHSASTKAVWCGCVFPTVLRRQIHNLCHMAVGSSCKVPLEDKGWELK